MKKLLLVAIAAFLTVLFIVEATNISGDSGVGTKTGNAAYLSAVLGDPTTAAAILSNREAKEDTVEWEPGADSDLTSLLSSSANAASSSSAAADKSAAIGNIASKFISPYSAPLSFGKIYMKNNTAKMVDIQSELSSPLDLKMNLGSEPEVLIMHTHATESYMMEDRDFYTEADASRSTDDAVNVVKIGDIVTETLQANGISVIHDKTQHDSVSYIRSYDNAKVTISDYIKKYPSIKVVIDFHRDAIGGGESDKVKTVCEVNGKNAAQVMLVMGCEDGSITNHPNWRQNLRLALRVQQASEIMYPGLARMLMLQPRCYNENLTKGSMLIEIGTDANTLTEAEYSAKLVGDVLSRVLKELK